MTTLLNTGVRKFTVSINGKTVDFLPKNIIKVDEKQGKLLLKYPDITEVKEQKISYKQRIEMKEVIEKGKGKGKRNKGKSEKND